MKLHNKKRPSIQALQEELIASFLLLESNREAILYHLIALGKEIEDISPIEKVASNSVPGCLSKIWLIGKEKEGLLLLKGDSNSMISKGFLSLLISVFSMQPLEEIMTSQLLFPKAIGLEDLLSVQRRGGLFMIWQRIQQIARNYLCIAKTQAKHLISN